MVKSLSWWIMNSQPSNSLDLSAGQSMIRIKNSFFIQYSFYFFVQIFPTISPVFNRPNLTDYLQVLWFAFLAWSVQFLYRSMFMFESNGIIRRKNGGSICNKLCFSQWLSFHQGGSQKIRLMFTAKWLWLDRRYLLNLNNSMGQKFRNNSNWLRSEIGISEPLIKIVS